MSVVIEIHQFPCLNDNYGYLVHEPGSGQTIAIDGAGFQANGGTFYPMLHALGDAEWDQMRAMIKGTNEKDKAERTTG